MKYRPIAYPIAVLKAARVALSAAARVRESCVPTRRLFCIGLNAKGRSTAS